MKNKKIKDVNHWQNEAIESYTYRHNLCKGKGKIENPQEAAFLRMGSSGEIWTVIWYL